MLNNSMAQETSGGIRSNVSAAALAGGRVTASPAQSGAIRFEATINIYPEPGQDVEAIARSVSRVIQTELERKGVLFA